MVNTRMFIAKREVWEEIGIPAPYKMVTCSPRQVAVATDGDAGLKEDTTWDGCGAVL